MLPPPLPPLEGKTNCRLWRERQTAAVGERRRTRNCSAVAARPFFQPPPPTTRVPGFSAGRGEAPSSGYVLFLPQVRNLHEGTTTSCVVEVVRLTLHSTRNEREQTTVHMWHVKLFSPTCQTGRNIISQSVIKMVSFTHYSELRVISIRS